MHLNSRMRLSSQAAEDPPLSFTKRLDQEAKSSHLTVPPHPGCPRADLAARILHSCLPAWANLQPWLPWAMILILAFVMNHHTIWSTPAKPTYSPAYLQCGYHGLLIMSHQTDFSYSCKADLNPKAHALCFTSTSCVADFTLLLQRHSV